MTGNELRIARGRLGELWGLQRPLHCSELGRALQLSKNDPGESIRMHEADREGAVPGPVAVAVQMMMAGALPPGGVVACLAKRKLRARVRLHRR